MAGRGRNATLPAWMTQNESAPTNGISNNVMDNQTGNYSTEFQQNADLEKPIDSRQNFQSDVISDRSNNRSRSKDKSKRRSKSPSRSRSRDRGRGRRERSKRSPSYDNKGTWKPKKDRSRNFDVKSFDNIEPVGVGLVSGSSNTMKFPDQLVSYVLQRYTGLVNTPTNSYNLLSTQNARRLYVGGITADTIETELNTFFVHIIKTSVDPSSQDVNDPVIQVYINREKCFAFVELRSVELTTACCSLDGLKFTSRSGVTVTLRIRRPNDFKPELLQGIALNPIPRIDLHKLGMVSSVVSSESADRIFVGGLPYHLTDENVKELLSVFGPLKSFHLVRDQGSITSKGYGFCEYNDIGTAQVAIQGLNGMAIGDKVLTVKFATQPNQPAAPTGLNMAAFRPSNAFDTNAFGNYPSTVDASMNAGTYGNGAYNQPLSQFTLNTSIPTRVLLLSNMITSAELNDGKGSYTKIEFLKLISLVFNYFKIKSIWI